MQHNADYFIRKFKQIPEELYSEVYEDGEKRCYMGHCDQVEAASLYKLLRKIDTSARTIIFSKREPYAGKTLKEKILIALKKIKNGHYDDL